MTLSDDLSYPPEILAAMDTVRSRSATALDLAQEVKKLADGVVAVSEGTVFAALQAAIDKFLADYQAHSAVYTAFAKAGTEAHQDMMATDRRTAARFY